MLIRPRQKLWVPSKPAIIVPSRRKLPDARRRIIPAICAAAFVNSANIGDSSATSTSKTITNFNSDNTGAATNTAAVFIIGFGGTTVPSVTVTWNGSSAGIAAITGASVTGTTTTCQAFGLVGISGTHNVVASWTGALSALLFVASFQGVDQTGGATTFAHGTANNVAANATHNLPITSAIGNMTVAAFFDDGGTLFSSLTGTGVTQDQLNSGGGPNGVSGHGTGAASVTMTANLAAADDSTGCGCDLKAAGGAAPVTPSSTSRLLMGVGI
jgi:hypothetical protein